MAKYTLKTSNIAGMPSGIFEFDEKTIITGANGDGKSTVLHCIFACLEESGKGLGKLSLKDLALDPKQPVSASLWRGEVCLGKYPTGTESDFRVLDLRKLAEMSGNQRVAAIEQLLGITVTLEEIKAALNKACPANKADLLKPILRNSAIDDCIKAANELKKADEAEARALGNPTADASFNVVESQCLIDKWRNSISDADLFEKKALLMTQRNDLLKELGNDAQLDRAALEAKVKKFQDVANKLTVDLNEAQSAVNAIGDKVKSLQSSLRDLKGHEGHCPTCGQAVAEEHKTALQQRIDKLMAEREAALEAKAQLQPRVDKASGVIAEMRNILSKLSRVANIGSEIETMGRPKLDGAVIAKIQGDITDLENKVAAHQNAIAAMERVEKLKATATIYRACEEALKSLKATKLTAKGLPVATLAMVKTLLGYDLSIRKEGRTADLCVSRDTTSWRPISTLSGGEWQVVAAAFASMLPDSIALVEAAEIDGQKLPLLLQALKDHPSPVVVASWCDVKAEGWTVTKVGGR